MKALVVPEANRLEVRDVPMPEITPYQALVRIETCGICNSTDQKLIEGTMYWAPPFPFVLGHESAGWVVETGSKVTKFKIGDLVTRPIYIPPPGAGVNSANGGFAEYGVVTDAEAMAADGDESMLRDYNAQRQLVLGIDMDGRCGALAISLSETASVLRHLPNPRGRKIVVAGTGIAGLAFTVWLKMAGAYVIVLGRRYQRLIKAMELGADWTINVREGNLAEKLREFGPLDGILEATGDAALAAELEGLLAPDGFACAYGVPPTGTHYGPRWKTAVVEEHLSLEWVVDLLHLGWLRPDWFISHDWFFDEVLEAFEQNRRGEIIKGFVHFEPEQA